ncbi:hypothetical protein OGATHE_004273 [Ogataea polymorpha]|uniref:Uncharacterized protein n=1 Tax=Ogataea polymorpha TaxID=460523 RepID=A0A9P8P0N8_9ASCO|nr:hypothetical protein OGATHE_004273 [Ogataea polymorpha]
MHEAGAARYPDLDLDCDLDLDLERNSSTSASYSFSNRARLCLSNFGKTLGPSSLITSVISAERRCLSFRNSSKSVDLGERDKINGLMDLKISIPTSPITNAAYVVQTSKIHQEAKVARTFQELYLTNSYLKTSTVPMAE